MASTTVQKPPPLAKLYARAARAALGDALPGLPRREGSSYRPRTLHQPGARLNSDRLADYQRTCGFRVGDRVPATYLHVLCFPLSLQAMTAPDFPFSLVGLVHVANAMAQRRPLHSREEVDLEVGVGPARPHRRGQAFDVTAEVRPGGQADPVWTSRSTYLARGRGDPDAPHEDGPVGPPEGHAAVARWSVPADIGRRYARVSGDVNPIHLHPLAARLFGFPRAIAHGMWTAARVLAALDARVGEAFDYDVAFARPLLLPAQVALIADRSGDGWRAAVRSSRGQDHLRAAVTDRRSAG